MTIYTEHDMLNPMDVMVDVDGCLYPFADAMEQYLISFFGPAPTAIDDTYRLYVHWQMSREEWMQHYRRAVEEEKVFLSHAPHDGGPQAIQALRDMGHRIIIVTARNLSGMEPLCQRQTEAWLDKHRIIYDELYLLSDKSQVRVDIAIEDTAKNLEALRDAHSALGILFTRPWNVKDSWDIRVTSWEQVPPLVENLAYMLRRRRRLY